MRVRSHWFREAMPKPPETIAHAAAVIAWRLAREALANLRKADFEVPAGPPYFALLAEYLAFFVALADRNAYGQMDEAHRARFTQALAGRIAEWQEENEMELLGSASRAAFIAHCNRRGDRYAECECPEGRPGFDFLRCLAQALAEHLPPRDQAWVHEQTMEIEGPKAADTLRLALIDLLGLTPATPRARAQTTGD